MARQIVIISQKILLYKSLDIQKKGIYFWKGKIDWGKWKTYKDQ